LPRAFASLINPFTRPGYRGRYPAQAMKWSKLKRLVESNLAADVADRIRFHTTRYRGAHDGMGRSWITLDGSEIMNMQHLSGSAALENTDRHQSGVYTAYDLPDAMAEFLTISIDDALVSKNPLIRALGVVDRRTGKRRIQLMDPCQEPFPVNEFIRLRRQKSENAG